METLWAPWRMELIARPKPGGCIFCDLPAQTGAAADRESLILGRSDKSFVIFNRYPYNNGHLMVVPRRHEGSFVAMPDDELEDLHRLLKTTTGVLQQAFKPEGFNIGLNMGKCAGAGIAEHLHYHVVPRWEGDTNFMPVLGQTKVIIEHLLSTYDTLKPMLDAALR